MQSKMRTNGAFLRNFDSKRYQELQQQKQQILRKQQELEKIKQKGKHTEMLKGKITVNVEVHSEDDSSYIDSDSDLQDVESIKCNSLYPCKPLTKAQDENGKSSKFVTEQTVQENKYKIQDDIVRLEISDVQNVLTEEVSKLQGNVQTSLAEEIKTLEDSVKMLSDRSIESLVNFAILEEAEDCATEDSLSAENIEKQNNETNEKANDSGVLNADLQKIDEKARISVNKINYKNVQNTNKNNVEEIIISGDIYSKGMPKKELDMPDGVKKKKPDVPERKHQKKVKVERTEMDISSSSVEFDSELSLESGIVYDPQRLVITEEQLSSLYVTSSSSG